MFGTRALIATALLARFAAGFNFQVADGTVNECGKVHVTWDEGSPPYKIDIITAMMPGRTLQISDNDIVTKDGLMTYEFDMPYAAGNESIFVMSDKTAFGTGGVSQKYTVGPRPSGAACVLTISGNLPFAFALDTKWLQCDNVAVEMLPLPKPYTVVYPVNVDIIVPGGTVERLEAHLEKTTQTLDVKAGTEAIVHVTDASGGEGGASAFKTIMQNPDAAARDSCVNDKSPHTTSPVALVPKTSSSDSAPKSTGSTGSSGSSSSGLSTGAIAGIAVAGVVAFIALQVILFWFCCKSQIKEMIAHRRAKKERLRNQGPLDLYDGEGSDMAMNSDAYGSAISPFMGGATRPTSDHMLSRHSDVEAQGYHAPSHFSRSSEGDAAWIPPVAASSSGGSSSGLLSQSNYTSSSRNNKMLMAASNPDDIIREGQPHFQAPAGGFLRHEDAGAIEPAAAAPLVEELPPTYNPSWESKDAP